LSDDSGTDPDADKSASPGRPRTGTDGNDDDDDEDDEDDETGMRPAEKGGKPAV